MWAERVVGGGRTVLLGALIGVGVGVLGLIHMPREEDPRLGDMAGYVLALYPGADAVVVERLVARPLEDVLAGVEHVKTLRTTCRAGVALINIDLRDNTKDFNRAWEKVRDSLDKVRPTLPASVASVVLDRDVMDPESFVLAVSGSGGLLSLRDAARKLKDQLQGVPGVKRVELAGDPGEEIRVLVDDAALSRRGVAREGLAGMLAGMNSDAPGGLVRSAGVSVPLRAHTTFESVEEIKNLPVSLPSGESIVLGELARVERNIRSPQSEEMRWNGAHAVGLVVVPRKGVNLIDLGKKLRTRLEELRAESAPYKIEEVAFQSDWTRQRLSTLLLSLATGVCGVGLVLMFWMGPRMGLLVSLSVPAITLMGLGAYFVSGGVLHQISVAAFLLSIGQFVDNVIVVAENIQRKIDAGQDGRHAAVLAVREMAFPLAAATGTALASFLPMMASQGATADFTFAIPFVAILTLLISYVYALTVTPVLSTGLLRAGTTRSPHLFRRWGLGLARLSLRRPGWIALGTIVWVVWMAALFGKVPQRFFPVADRNEFVIVLEFPEGTSWERTHEEALALETQLRSDAGVQDVGTWVGRGVPRFYYNLPLLPESPHIAHFLIRTRSRRENNGVADRARQWGAQRWGPAVMRVHFLEQGPPIEAPIEVRVQGEDLAAMRSWAASLGGILSATPGTRDVRINTPAPVPALDLPRNDRFLTERGWTRSDVARAARFSTLGLTVGQYRGGRDPAPIVLRGPWGVETSSSTLRRAVLGPSQSEDRVLSDLGNPTLTTVWPVIYRRNRERVVTLSADLNPEASYPEVLRSFRSSVSGRPAPPGISWSFGGQEEGSQEANTAILKSIPLGMGVLLIFLMAQFQSFRKLAILSLTVPLAVFGIVPGLLLGRVPFGFMSILAILSLTGIIINNAMLVMEAIDAHRARGQSLDGAIRRAVAERLRPILLTAIVTILDMIPLALQDSTLWPPLAWPIISGLASGTALTLLVVPALYRVCFQKRRKGTFLAAILLLGGSARALTIEEVMNVAEQSARVQSAVADSGAAVERYRSVNRQAHAPRLEAGVTGTAQDRVLHTDTPGGPIPFGVRRYGEGVVSLTQPLWSPAIAGPLKRSAQYRQRAAESQEMVERRRARFEAGALALDLLGVMAERQALVDSIRNLENLKRESDRLFRLGHLRETDVLKVALALDDARQGLLQLNASEQNIRAALSRWVPGPQPMSLEPPGPFVGFAVQEPLERPELKALGWEEQARWEAAAFEKTSGGPLLEAQGRWLHTGQDTLAERRWAEGRLILSWRLWDGARSARSVAAEKEAQSAALLRDDLRSALAAEKTAAENQVRVVTEEVHRSLPNRDRARQNLEGERRRYQNGRVSMGDLLEAEALSLRWEREARLAPLRLARAYLQFELASGRNPSLPFANKLK